MPNEGETADANTLQSFSVHYVSSLSENLPSPETCNILTCGFPTRRTQIALGNTLAVRNESEAGFGAWNKYISNADLSNLPRITIAGTIDAKIKMKSLDADNHSIIEALDAKGNVLSRFGYYGSDGWCIDGVKIATK